MKNRKIKLHRLLIVIAPIVMVGIGLVYVLVTSLPTKVVGPTNSSPIPSQESYVYEDWLKNKTSNEEYIGNLTFEEGLISEQVVQTRDNEKYLNLSWDLTLSSHGAVFLDYRNTLDDQNIILYGHYVYDDESLMFGPLHDLISQENYEKNKVINLKLEDEVRTYEIANVFYYEMDNPTLEYFHTNFEEEYLKLYMENVKKRSFYETGIDITKEDRFLTLQTCVRNRDDLRLIIIAKMI